MEQGDEYGDKSGGGKEKKKRIQDLWEVMDDSMKWGGKNNFILVD